MIAKVVKNVKKDVADSVDANVTAHTEAKAYVECFAFNIQVKKISYREVHEGDAPIHREFMSEDYMDIQVSLPSDKKIPSIEDALVIANNWINVHTTQLVSFTIVGVELITSNTIITIA
jgi:hypothetical protein